MKRRHLLVTCLTAAALAGGLLAALFCDPRTLLEPARVGSIALILGFSIATAALYRAHLDLRMRYRSLTQTHEFVQQGLGTGTVPELAALLLARTRRVLRAGAVELIVHLPDADLVMRVETDDSFSRRQLAVGAADDRLTARLTVTGEPLLIPRHTRHRGLRQWLAGRDVREAMLVPLAPAGIAPCTLIVTDRLGQGSTFGPDDLTLLQTLATHIVVAMRGTHLVEQLRHDATHDSLTGLANRTRLATRIEQAIVAPGVTPAVLMLDLDRFKEVNDAFGHPVGDALLRIVATRIGNCVPAGSTLARLGGDTFAVLLAVADGEPGSVEGLARALAADVLAALGSPVALAEAALSVRAGIGIAIGGPGRSGVDLLRFAETAMYAAKTGSRPVVLYADDLDHGRAERLTMLADLHTALQEDQFVLRYQPQLDLDSDRIVSVEALVRWQHPVRGLLAPDEFIPLAESSGLIQELTHQVLRKALRQNRIWRDAGIDLVMAVNLSANSVDNVNLPEDVAAALADAGLPADRLVLEITESSVMGDPQRTVPILQRLADIGVRLSLDDFGTGYSSLAYLQRLPVSEVKIDKSFVMGMAGGGEMHASSVLVRSILTLGSNLGLRVVAEGVEDIAVLEQLRGLGCDLAQGFHIARPLPAGEISDLMLDAANNLLMLP